MSDNRKYCLNSIKRYSRCKVILVTPENLDDWILPDYPLHEGYEFLAEIVKGDYLKAYFMYHYGGGYADIKYCDFDWRPYFGQLEKDPNLWCIGYKEIGPHGVAAPRDRKEELRKHWDKLIGNCAYIFKPHTPLAEEWLRSVNRILDNKLDLLREHPSREPFDYLGKPYYPGGFEGVIRRLLKRPRYSKFPIRWAEICGEVFHPLVWKYNKHISNELPMPKFDIGYR